MVEAFKAGKHQIGPGAPCFVIAEAGVNHNGSLSLAMKLVDAASDAGADAVKFQTFRAENLVTREAPMAEYQAANTGLSESQFDMLKKLELSRESHQELISYCESRNIEFLSTPFSEESALFLSELKLPLMKIPSGEITNIPYLRYLAKLGVPLVLSTGMSNIKEVERAVQIFREADCQDFCILHCTSNYPAAFESVNLKAMDTMREAFDCPVGYSDHTLGIEISVAAAAMGASMIEKHFTLDRRLEGPDHKASLEPHELKSMVGAIRNVEKAIGDGVKRPVQEEASTAAVARKSIVADRDIAKDAVIAPLDLKMLRPGTGLSSERLPDVVGRRAVRLIRVGELVTMEMLA